MKYLLIIGLFFVSLHHIKAQDLESRLRITDKVDCSVYAENSSKLIGTYDIFDLDSVAAVLDIWERECGKSEPIMRLRVLHDIYKGQFDSNNYVDYYDQYIRKYIYRIEAQERSTVRSNYEQSKSYYDHTQIGNGFDQHTLALAQVLIGDQIEGSDAHLICILFTNDFKKFKETSYYKSVSHSPLLKSLFDSREGLFSNIRISGGVGVWLPLGNNRNSFGGSPIFFLAIHQPLSRSWRMDGTISVVPFINNRALNFRFEGKDESTESLVAFNLQLGLARVTQLSEDYFLDVGFSLGFNIMGTDIEDEDKEDTHHSIGTMDFGAKVALRRKLVNGKSIAIQSAIHYAPYNWSSSLKSEVGNSYATIGLLFGF